MPKFNDFDLDVQSTRVKEISYANVIETVYDCYDIPTHTLFSCGRFETHCAEL